jgi:hypothetical protein
MIYVGRLELAWIILLFSTLSVDTLSASEAIAGNLRIAQGLRFLAVVIAIALCIPNIQRAFSGSGRSISIGFGTSFFSIYIFVAILSILWTVSPIVTAGKSIELLTALLIVSSVTAQKNSEWRLLNLFNLTIIFMLVILITIFIGYTANPDLFTQTLRSTGNERLDAGFVPISSNAIARFGAYTSLFFLAVVLFFPPGQLRWRVSLWILVSFGVLMALMAHGRTGLAAIAVGSVLLVVLRKPVLGISLGIALSALSVLMIPSFWSGIAAFIMRGQTEEMFFGLTGRMNWWHHGMDAYMEHWLLGYGYGIGSRVAFVSIDMMEVASIHNGFLEVFLGVGLLGGVFWIVSLIILSWRSGTAIFFQTDIPRMIMIIPLLFATVLSSGIGGWWSIEVGLVIILLALQDYRARRIKKNPHLEQEIL